MTNRNSNSGNAEQAAASLEAYSLIDFVLLARRRLVYAIVGGLLGAAIAVGLALQMPEKFVSRSELIVDLRGYNVSQNELSPAPQTEIFDTLVNTELNVLRSDTIMRMVVSELQLHRLEEFKKTSALAPILALITPPKTVSEEQAISIAQQTLAKKVSVTRRDETLVLDVAVATQQATRSQELNQAILSAYLNRRLESDAKTSTRILDDMRGQVDTQAQQLSAAERAVEDFKIANNILGAEGRLNNELQVTTITNQLNAAQFEAASLAARVGQLERVIGNGVGTLLQTGVFQSTVLTDLRTRLATAEDNRSTLSTTYAASHPRIVQANAQIDGLVRAIRAEAANEVRSARQNLLRAQSTVAALEGQLAELEVETGDVNQSLVKLRQLERDAEAARSVYIATLTRFQEISAQTGVDTSNVKVVSSPDLPINNEAFSKKLLVALGLFMGASAGLLFGMIFGRNPQRTNQAASPATIESKRSVIEDEIALGSANNVPQIDELVARKDLAAVPATSGLRLLPLMNATRGARRLTSMDALMKTTGLATLAQTFAPSLAQLQSTAGRWQAPKLFDGTGDASAVSPISKVCQQLFERNETDGQVVLLLSISAGASSSPYAANLAAYARQNGGDVLYIDANHSSLGMWNLQLSQASENTGHGSETYRIGEAGLDYVSTICAAETEGDSPRMLVQQFAEQAADYDLTIIDGGELASQQLLGSLVTVADQIILVVEQDRTSYQEIDSGYEALGAAVSKTAGVLYLAGGVPLNTGVLTARDLPLNPLPVEDFHFKDVAE